MDINEIKSVLTMENFYFSKCALERSASIQDSNLRIDLSKKIEKTDEHQYSVELTLTIQGKDIQGIVIANARFQFGGDDTSREESIIQKNTVAIMYPFIRSQVTLLTSQPGLTPIVLPPIDTTKLK